MSHTTDDMIFQWDPDVPLVVDENIELPQLALVKNYTADCTQVYSTGQYFIYISLKFRHLYCSKYTSKIQFQVSAYVLNLNPYAGHCVC